MNSTTKNGLHVQGADRQNSRQSDFGAVTPLYHRRPLDSRTAVVLAARQATRRAAWRDVYVTSAQRVCRLLEIFRSRAGVDADTQKARLILALQEGPLTTLEARRHLDVMAVSARIADLRQDGHVILTNTVLQASDLGRTRLIGQYVLVEGAAS